ncbi:Amino acid ABC transporter, amino acid-binding/permease protein [Lachnospiraceae bacterium TWA4]|nr:Amino acid ABC transporter, amino acid-binding/permease protein [Lachnospiraceae bacterium TWA4]
MKKQLVAGALCATLAMTALVGCSGGTGKETKGTDTNASGKATLKVATSPDFAPYEFEDPSKEGQEKYVGADMELARYIAKELDMELEIVPMAFDSCLAAVTQDKVDCSISGFYPSEDRRKIVDFSDAYFDDATQQVVILASNADKYTSTESFDGEVVAAQNGSAQQDIVTNDMPNAKLQQVTLTTDGVQMVRSGKAAGVVLQKVMADSVLASDSSLTVSKAEYINPDGTLVVAMKKGNEDLTKKVNEVIKKVTEEKLYDQWIVEAQKLAPSAN